MLKRMHDEERGLAMVVSLMVVFVVLLLASAVFAQSIHNSDQSAYDRRRLQSVDAAEAGLNYFSNYMEQTAVVDLASRCGIVTAAGLCTSGNPFADPQPITVAIAPGTASFSVTATWYSAVSSTGNTPFSGTITNNNYPKAVKVVSGGTTNGVTTRTMETFMSLTGESGGFRGAVITNTTLGLTNSFSISGDTIYNGDIYVTCTTPPCNANLTSGTQTIKGNLYVPSGSLTISTSVHIYGSVWANGNVLINQPQVQIDGDATSSTGSLTVSSGRVNGKGTYCTTVSGGANVGGGTVGSCQSAPPTPAFPQLLFDDTVSPAADADWLTGCSDTPITNCYTVKTFGTVGSTSNTACTQARSYIEGTGASNYDGGSTIPSSYAGVIVRILSKCNYSASNNAIINLNTDLAIITNGSITLGQQSNWNGMSSVRKVHLIVPGPQSTCSTNTASSDYHDITVGNQSNFNSLTDVGLYTPCTAHMSNQNAFYGQVVGGTVDIQNNWNMNYRPTTFPGALVTGFAENIAYIREI
jgi:Tfp pilus assembly protein PilX